MCLCLIYILVNWICTARRFQCGSEDSASAGQSSRLWQTAASDHTTCIYLLSRLLSSPVHSFPLYSSSVRKGEERQIRLLPQKLPITARQCVQHCCLRNAEFVNPVLLKGICEPILAVVLNEESTVGVWISECMLHS